MTTIYIFMLSLVDADMGRHGVCTVYDTNVGHHALADIC